MNKYKEIATYGVAKRFIEDRLAVGMVSFSMDDLTKSTGLSEIAARNQLLHLGESIKRVTPRQAFFLIVTPEHRAFGIPPVDLWLGDYFTWLGRPYYLALQSAAAIYGSSGQAIQETQVMTDVPMRNILFSRARLRFYTKSGLSHSLTQQASNAAAPLLVSTVETTAFDLVRYASNIGGIERVAETIRPMIPLMRPRQLEKMLEAENELACAQRLGYILIKAGEEKLAGVVMDWLPKYRKNVPLALGVRVDKDMPIDAIYGVIMNSSGL